MRTTLLAVIAIITMPLFSRAQSTLSFPRVIPPAEFRATGFAIVNPGSTNATVIFTLFGEDGGVQQTSTQTIVARGQLAKFASEFFPAAKNAGWVQAASATPGLQGFWLGGDMTTFADGAEAAPSSSEMVVPLTTGNSEIDIANTGAADVTMVIDLLGQEGFDLAIPWPQKIPAKGFFKSDIAAIFGSADLSQTAHLRIKCGCANLSSFAAVLIARDFIAGPSWAVVNAVPASTSATVMNFSQLIDGPVGSNNYRSVLGITNLSTTSANDVTITFTSESGAVQTAPRRTLPPNGEIRGAVRDFGLTASSTLNGWLRVSSTNGLPLTGFVAYAETIGAGVAVVPPQLEAQTNLLFAHIANLAPWRTGLALLNTNSSDASVEVFALRPAGTLIGVARFPLAAGAKTAKLLSEWIPQMESRTSDGGFVFVRSDLPLFGTELFFSRDGQILANVAAGRILPGIVYVPPSQ